MLDTKILGNILLTQVEQSMITNTASHLLWVLEALKGLEKLAYGCFSKSIIFIKNFA